MASIGFKIKDDFDVEVVNGLFVFTRDESEVAQRMKHELLTIQGEVVDTPARGLDLFGIMLNETSSKTQRKDEITRALSYIDEITVLEILEEVIDRVAKYYIKVQYGDTTETVTFEVE